jgi:RNA polymerase primary sigma factor
MLETVARARRAQMRLRTELGRQPTLDELAEQLDLDRPHAHLVRRLLASKTGSLDATAGSGEEADSSLAGLISDEASPQPDEVVFDQMELQALGRVLKTVSQREARILALRFGLNNAPPMTLREVGSRMDLSRERVRQIEKKAMRKIEEQLRAAGYDGVTNHTDYR